MSREIDVLTGQPVEVLRMPDEVTFRVGVGALMSGQDVTLSLRLDSEGTRVEAVELTLNAYRSQLLKWVKAEQPPFDVPTLLRFAPMQPVTVRLEGTPELSAPFEPALAEGRALTDCLTSPGRHGFPAFFDLENYTYRDAHQR
jgi:hypothetical protein